MHPANTQSNMPAIGDLMPSEGGTLAAILARPDGTTYGLIVADASHDIEGEWGEYGQAVDGARGTDGMASTQAMAQAGSEIAQKVLAMDIAGHRDWYIPSRLELLACYELAPQLFERDGWYWSSTQYSRYYAWCQAFEYGHSYANGKDDEFRARPVRSIQLQPFTPSALPQQSIGEADPREIFEAAVAV